MVDKDSEVFLGEEFSDPEGFGKYYLTSHDDHLAMAISVGGKSGCHLYTDLCEDSSAYIVIKDYRIAVVADAYYGVKAASTVVKFIEKESENLINVLENSFTPSTLKKWTLDHLYNQSLRIFQETKDLPYREQSRCQLSLVIKMNDDVIWLNMGDTRIYTTFETASGHMVSKPKRASTIGYPNSQLEFSNKLQVGAFNIQEDGTVIVCSDGFPEVNKPEQDIPPEDLIEWLGDYDNAEDAVSHFMEEAIEREACDNLSVGILTHHSQ